MVLSKTARTHDTEDTNLQLRKWRKTISAKIFANNSFVDAGVKTALLNAVEDGWPEVYIKSQDLFWGLHARVDTFIVSKSISESLVFSLCPTAPQNWLAGWMLSHLCFNPGEF